MTINLNEGAEVEVWCDIYYFTHKLLGTSDIEIYAVVISILLKMYTFQRLALVP